VIERWVGGRKFHVSTRCTLERAALEQLALFEANPAGYKPQGTKPLETLRMTAELIDAYETYQTKIKGSTEHHARAVGGYLERWMEKLEGADLRAVTTYDLRAMLGTWETAKRYRVIALKGFFTWLRSEKGLLKRADDAALDLMVPGFKAEKLTRKKVVEQDVVLKVLAKLDGQTRDVLKLLAATGLHITEARRFVESGELFERTPEQDANVLANLAVKHKNGELHVVAISDDEVLTAAKRLKAARTLLDDSSLAKYMREASDAAGVKPRVTLGVMRHSVATWLARDGVPLAQIADFLGHLSPVTTAKFYRDMGKTARALPVPKLRLVKG
jgi:integrase